MGNGNRSMRKIAFREHGTPDIIGMHLPGVFGWYLGMHDGGVFAANMAG